MDANVHMQIRIRISHHQDIGGTRWLFRTMLEELEAASSTEGQELIKVPGRSRATTLRAPHGRFPNAWC